MNTLAYINGDITTEQYQDLINQNVTSILIDVPREENNEKVIDKSLKTIIESLRPGDKLIIYDLTNLYQTLSELALFFKQAKEKEIELVILNKEEIFNSMTDKDFMEFIHDLNEENHRVVQKKIERSKKTSKSVGRPKLSQENIKRIRHLRLEKKYTLSDTAELCGVSVGTVHKYADRVGE